MYVARRRLIILVALAGLVALGLTLGLFAGHGHSAGPVPVDVPRETVPPAAPTTVPCPAVAHSPEGAAVTAAAGLHALSEANLGPIDAHPDEVTATLDRYVAPERRPVMRQYLTAYPSSFQSITTTPLAWTAESYSPSRAVVRFSASDIAVTATGTETTDQGVTDATLTWDDPSSSWRLSDWKVNTDPAAASALTVSGTRFCHA